MEPYSKKRKFPLLFYYFLSTKIGTNEYSIGQAFKGED
jgi:hypothetical protein